MIKSVTVINYVGDHLELPLANPYETGMAITEIEGLGPGSADIITSDNASMDGAVFNSSRQSSRNIVITLKILGTEANSYSIESTRHQIYKYFPIKKPLWLIFETDKRDATIQGYVESNEPEIFSDWETTKISIICPNPYFKALESQETEIEELGTTVNYSGEVETGIRMVMELSGTVGDTVKVKDDTTGDIVEINTKKIEDKYGTFSTGDRIEICSVKGEKEAIYIKNGDSTYSIFNALTRHPSWIELLKGANSFSYIISQAYSTNFKLTITNDVLYEGL